MDNWNRFCSLHAPFLSPNLSFTTLNEIQITGSDLEKSQLSWPTKASYTCSKSKQKVAFSVLTLLVGYQKSTWSVKSWVMRCWRGCLSGVRRKWLHKVQLMPLPSSSPAWLKSRMVFAFLRLAYPGFPAKEAIKQVFVLKANKSECTNTTKCNIQTMPHFITFCMRHSRGEMYVHHSRLYYVSVCPSRHSHTTAQTWM